VEGGGDDGGTHYPEENKVDLLSKKTAEKQWE